MRKKIIIIFIVILLVSALIGVGLYYLNTYYLPQIFKTKIAEEASKKLGALIQIGDIRLSLFKGIVVHNLIVRNKKDSSLILEADRVYANFLLLPFFKERKIIFPIVGLDGAKINITRDADNSLNIQNLIPKQIPLADNKENKKNLPPILIYRLDINNSSIYFLDKAISPNIEHTLKLNSIRAQLSASSVNFNARGALTSQKQTSNIKLSGSFQFKNSELKISSQIDNIDATVYLAYLNNLPIDIKILSLSQINIDADLLDNKISADASMVIEDASLVKDKSSISQASAKINGSVNIDLKNLSSLNYLVNIDNVSANISDAQIPENSSIQKAKFTLMPNKLDIQNLQVKTLDTSVNLTGKLENFLNPIFNFNVQTSIDIAKARNFLKQYVAIDESIIAQGKTDVNINIAKEKDKKDISYKGSLNLTNASLKTNKAPYQIDAINGIINFDQAQANWSDLSFGFMASVFKSKAQITNFTSPSILLEVNGDKINFSAKINSNQKNNFNIEYFKGNYYNSQFNSAGTLALKDENNINADLTIQSKIDLNDLLGIPYLATTNITQIKPQGLLSIDGKIKGNLKDIKSLNGILNFTSDELKFYGFSLKGLQLQVVTENQQIKVPDSSAKFYDGTVTLNGVVDLTQGNNPCAFNLAADNIDLSRLKMDTPAKDKEIQGILVAKTVLTSQMDKDFLPSLKGQGQFLIKDGYLWEFNPLKKLGDFLFIPRYQTLVFKEAKADFTIQDQKVSTDNLTLNSNIITLVCEGNMDFAGNLDFEIAPYPVTQQSQEPPTTPETQTTPIASILNEQMSKLAGISLVQVTGTIQNPKISMKMVTKEVVDKLKEGVTDTVKTIKGVLGSIFGGSQE